MKEERKGVTRKLVHAGGWQVVKRTAKMLPLGGTVIALGLIGHDIRRKGLIKGVINSGLDALPVIGLAKNGIELVTGDFISDKKSDQNRGKNGR